jgi:hypothetical protein
MGCCDCLKGKKCFDQALLCMGTWGHTWWALINIFVMQWGCYELTQITSKYFFPILWVAPLAGIAVIFNVLTFAISCTIWMRHKVLSN